MVIKRKHEDGTETEIELTAEEMRLVYEEQEHIYDMEDIKRELERYIEADKYDDELGEDAETASIFLRDEEMISDLAYAKRDWMDKYNTTPKTATRRVVNDNITGYEITRREAWV